MSPAFHRKAELMITFFLIFTRIYDLEIQLRDGVKGRKMGSMVIHVARILLINHSICQYTPNIELI